MPSQQLTPDGIRKAQELVGRIKGVSSCQISTDDEGAITEVHVVAHSNKPPKLIARDVETFLKAEMNVDVDHRKIGVVLFDRDEAPPAAPPAPPPGGDEVVEFPVEEYTSRFAFRSVNLYISDETTRAEVELTRLGETAFGSAQTDRPNVPAHDVIAQATLQALLDYLDETSRLCLGGVRRVTIEDAIAYVVRVDLVTGRDRKTLVGASAVSGNENQAVVFAALDAVNRVLGRLNTRSAVEYKIK